MKNAIGYIFIDDGSPEASDYDDNYVAYVPADADSYKAAKEQARRLGRPAAKLTKQTDRRGRTKEDHPALTATPRRCGSSGCGSRCVGVFGQIRNTSPVKKAWKTIFRKDFVRALPGYEIHT